MSNKQLISAFGATLDWQQRFKLLQDLEMALEDPEEPLVLTSQELQALREPILKFVLDLRSTLAKKACETCALLAERCPTAFQTSSQIFISTLLKQVTTTVKVISDAAHSALCQIILNASAVPVSKAFPEIQKGCQDKNNMVLRKSCATYLALLLRERSINTLLPYLDAVVETVSGLLRDADPQARRAARICYAILKLYSVPHAEKVYSKADAKVKPLLDDASFSEEIDLNKASGNSSLASPSGKTSVTSSRQQSRSTSPERERSDKTVDSPTKAATSPSLSKTQPKVPASTVRRAAIRSPTPLIKPDSPVATEPLSEDHSTPNHDLPSIEPVDMNIVIRKLQRYSVSADSLKQLQMSINSDSKQNSDQLQSNFQTEQNTFDFHKELVRLRRLLDQTRRVLERVDS